MGCCCSHNLKRNHKVLLKYFEERVSGLTWTDAFGEWKVLAQSSGFAFGFQEGQDVAFADWSLHISDDSAGWVVQELDLYLCALSLGACAAEDFDYACQNHWFIHFSEFLWSERCSRCKDSIKKGETETEDRLRRRQSYVSQFAPFQTRGTSSDGSDCRFALDFIVNPVLEQSGRA